MIIKIESTENSHYFYVMAWKGDKRNAPIQKKRFDIYEDAVDFYNTCVAKYCRYKGIGYVEMFEYTGGKRKGIVNSKEGKQ